MAEVFLVGGAVRDMLMGIKPKDFDFVVVGSSPIEMEALGFQKVGADFPVFLHPTTGDEFALARTERKTAEGHAGFDCEWEGVTLEEDLSRRDLTINAMAVQCNGFDPSAMWVQDVKHDFKKWPLQVEDDPFGQEVIDPFGGVSDIENKVLRHTSEAFAEDPLRVLRLARFLARFGEGWHPAADTMVLIQDMINQGMLTELTPERVWKEVSRALMEPRPDAFFKFLWLMDANIIPELDRLFFVPQRKDFHPEGDAGIHTMLCLQAASAMNLTLEERFAVLCHDLGKFPAWEINSAKGKNNLGNHEVLGLDLVDAVCERWKVPNDCKTLARLVTKDHTNIHNLKNLRPNTIAKMFERWDLIRHPERALQIMNCCTADGRGRGPDHENDTHPSVDILPHFVAAWLQKVDVDAIQAERKEKGRPLLTGQHIGARVRKERLERLTEVKKALKTLDTE